MLLKSHLKTDLELSIFAGYYAMTLLVQPTERSNWAVCGPWLKWVHWRHLGNLEECFFSIFWHLTWKNNQQMNQQMNQWVQPLKTLTQRLSLLELGKHIFNRKPALQAEVWTRTKTFMTHERAWQIKSSCIMKNIEFSVLVTKSQDVSAAAASLLLFNEVHQLHYGHYCCRTEIVR